MEGKKELLGIWIGKNEGSKFWMQVVTELKNRGVKEIYVACVDVAIVFWTVNNRRY